MPAERPEPPHRPGLLRRLFGPWPETSREESEPTPTLDRTAVQTRLRAKAPDLTGERLNGLDLRDLDFRGATLAKVDFGDADVTDAKFRDADLREANLEGARGLIPEQLAGADLTRCKLPADVKGFPQLENVKEISKNAGALFLTMMLACVFVLITTVSTRDIQLLTSTGTAQLPFLNVAVATPVFFTVVPVVLIMLYATVHLYLQRLWALMATLPAFFPDGTRVERKTYPWLLNDLIQGAFPRLRPKGWRILFVQYRLFAFIAYNVVSLTLSVVWLRCLAKHDSDLSFWQATFFLVAVVLGPLMKNYHECAMGGPPRRALRTLSGLAALGVAALPFVANGVVGTGFTISPSAAQRPVLQRLGLSGGRPLPTSRWDHDFDLEMRRLRTLKDADGGLMMQSEDELRRTVLEAEASVTVMVPRGGVERAVRWALARQPLFTAYGTMEEDLSRRPDKWEGEPGEPSSGKAPEPVSTSPRDRVLEVAEINRKQAASIGRMAAKIPRATFVHLGGRARPNLRFLRARGAFLVNSDFRGADLTGADLSGADLRGALWQDETVKVTEEKDDLPQEAHPRAVDLSFAELSGSDLSSTNLAHARLTGAILRNARVIGSELPNAVLTGADLTGTDLTRVNLSGATLVGAILPGSLTDVVLSEARLMGATLGGSMSHVDLSRAHLDGANLSGSWLYDVDFYGASLVRADLSDTHLSNLKMQGADISGANLDSEHLGNDVDLSRAYFRADLPPIWPKGSIQKRDSRGDVLALARSWDGTAAAYQVVPYWLIVSFDPSRRTVIYSKVHYLTLKRLPKRTTSPADSLAEPRPYRGATQRQERSGL